MPILELANYYELDLSFTRIVDVKPELIWKCWTIPEHLKVWFCPAPWKVVDCEIDLKPGGAFMTVMQSPEGQNMPANTGCYLSIIPERELIWTGALSADYRPNETSNAPFVFTAKLTFEPYLEGTKYTAIVMHSNHKGKVAHEDMGFHAGWGKALDQLIDYVKTWK